MSLKNYFAHNAIIGGIILSSLGSATHNSRIIQDSQRMILEGIVLRERGYDTLDHNYFTDKDYVRHFHYFEIETSDKKRYVLNSFDLDSRYIDLMLNAGDYVKVNAPRYGFLGTSYREIFFDCIIDVKRNNSKK